MDQLYTDVAFPDTFVWKRGEEGLRTEGRGQTGGSHYKSCAIQPVDYIFDNELGYLEGNVVKYVTRHKSKNGAEDIMKCIDYCNMILEKVYGYDPK